MLNVLPPGIVGALIQHRKGRSAEVRFRLKKRPWPSNGYRWSYRRFQYVVQAIDCLLDGGEHCDAL